MQLPIVERPSRLDRAQAVAHTLFRLAARQARGRAAPALTPPSLTEELVDALEALGGTFVKLGQTLACRTDLLPRSVTDALARLHDDVQPLPAEEVHAQLQQSLQRDLSEVFTWFDPEPLGSASLGQVHRARLHDGRIVAVKVQRPGVRDEVEADRRLMTSLAWPVDALEPFGSTVRLREHLDAFAATMALELDYRVEAENLRRMRWVVRHHHRVQVPRPIDELCRESVLVMAYVKGTPLGQLPPGEVPHGPELARQLVHSYLEQILEHGFFHADPHPGNLLIDDGLLNVVDLGWVQRLDPDERQGVARMVHAMVQADGRRAAEALRRLCTADDPVDVERLTADVREVVHRAEAVRNVEPILGETVLRLLGVAMDHGLRPPPRLGTFGRTLALLDDSLQRLDPDLVPATVARELTRPGGHDGASGPSPLASWLPAGALASDLARVPEDLARLVEKLSAGSLEVQVDAFDEDRVLSAVQKIANRIAAAVIVAALLLSGAMLDDTPAPEVFGLAIHSVALLGLGFVGALSLLVSILWIDR